MLWKIMLNVFWLNFHDNYLFVSEPKLLSVCGWRRGGSRSTLWNYSLSLNYIFFNNINEEKLSLEESRFFPIFLEKNARKIDRNSDNKHFTVKRKIKIISKRKINGILDILGMIICVWRVWGGIFFLLRSYHLEIDGNGGVNQIYLVYVRNIIYLTYTPKEQWNMCISHISYIKYTRKLNFSHPILYNFPEYFFSWIIIHFACKHTSFGPYQENYCKSRIFL